MSNISDFIFNSIKSKLPEVNWSIGSLVRELIATPIIKVTESASTALMEQINATNVHRFTDNPEDYKNEIEQTFYDLGFEEAEPTDSTGVITIYTDTADVLPVFSGTLFHYNDYNVYTTKDAFPALGNSGNEPRFTQMRKLGVNSYAFDIPVSSAFVNVHLSEGTSLSWDEAPSYVYNVKVTSAVSGGADATSLKDKAEIIKDYLAPAIIPLNDSITKILKNNLPSIVVDAKYADNSSNTSYLCVKTKKSPSTYNRTVNAYRIGDGIYQLTYKEPGIINLVGLYINEEPLQVLSHSVSNNVINATFSFKGDAVELVTVKLRGLEDLQAVQLFLDGYTAGSPYRIEVKAPNVLYLGCQFSCSGDLNSTDIMKLCEIIQSYSLDEMPNDNKIATMLSSMDVSLINSVIFTLTDNSGSYYKYRAAAQVPTNMTGIYALYTSVDRIKVNNV